MKVNILTIAGSDSGGGAGIQADLKTIGALGGYGLSVITAVTAQNTRGVAAVHDVPVKTVAAQLDAVFSDIRIDAVKIGMVGSPKIIEVIVQVLQKYQPAYVVVDPVMVSTSGSRLASDETIAAMSEHLIPMTTVLTPNIPEAEILLDRKFDGDMEVFSSDILKLGAQGVLLKGGHLGGDCSNDLFCNRNESYLLRGARVETENTHGTGCTLSSALAVYLALGLSGQRAAAAAKSYVIDALEGADDLDVGQGPGPLNHMFMLKDNKV